MTPAVPVRRATNCQAFQAGVELERALTGLVMRPAVVARARRVVRRERAAGVAAVRAVMRLKTPLTFW